MAISDIANKIKCGELDCGIGAGVELYECQLWSVVDPCYSHSWPENPEMQKCLIPMGITNENVAAKFSIPRNVQDELAAKSYNKAAKAAASGAFK